MNGGNPDYFGAQVTISLGVYDEAELLAAGRARAVKDGCDPDNIKTASDALIMLLNPDGGDFGSNILGSTCEITR